MEQKKTSTKGTSRQNDLSKQTKKLGKANEHPFDSKYNVTFVGEPCIEDLISGFRLFLDEQNLAEKENYKDFFKAFCEDNRPDNETTDD